MNKRLIDKHSVSIVSSQRAVFLLAESSSEIDAINLLGRIFDKKVLYIVLPQSVNPSCDLRVVFVDGSSLNIYWYESENTRFNFYFLPEDWDKIDKFLSE